MAHLSNIALNNKHALMIQLDLVDDTYSESLISEAVDNRIDGRIRDRQEMKGNVQQLHECFSMAEVRGWLF